MTSGISRAAATIRRAILVASAILVLGARIAAAQNPSERFATEWGVTTGGAMDVPGGAEGGEFWAAQLRWGKVLTSPHGPGPLRGTFEYAFEIVPAMLLRQAYWPTYCENVPVSQFLYFDPCAFALPHPKHTIFGGGLTPLVLQWNFTSSERLVPFFQIAGGALWTTRDFPHIGSSFNFTPQGGIGAYWFVKPQRAVSFGLRFHHISNAGITDPNPGHNALYFYGGLSWWR